MFNEDNYMDDESKLKAAIAHIAELQAEVEKVRLSADDAHLSRIAAEEERELLRKDRDAIKSCEVDARRYRIATRLGFAICKWSDEVCYWIPVGQTDLDNAIDITPAPLPGEPV